MKVKDKNIKFNVLTTEDQENLLKGLKEFREEIRRIREEDSEILLERLNNNLKFFRDQSFISNEKWEKVISKQNNVVNNVELDIKAKDIISNNKNEIKEITIAAGELQKNKTLGNLGNTTLNEIVDKGMEVFTHISELSKKYPVGVSGVVTSISSYYVYKGVVKLYDKLAFSEIPTNLSAEDVLKHRLMRSRELKTFMVFGAPLIVGTLLTIKNVTFPSKINIQVGVLSNSDSVLADNNDVIKTIGFIAFIKKRIPFWLIQILIIVISLICLNYLFDYSNVNNDNVIKSIILNNLVFVKIFFMLGVFTSFMIICYYIVSLYLFIRFSKVIRTNNKDKIDNLIPTYLPLFMLKWLNLIKSLSHSSNKGLFIEIYLRLILIYMLIFLSTIFVLIQLIKI